MSEIEHTGARIPSLADPLRILLIEDSKGDVLLIKQAIKWAMTSAYEIEVAEKLETALTLLSDQEFDVALLDRGLPDAEDFDGLHSIQSMAPNLPVIYLTGHQDEQVAFDSIEQGAQDYLYKDKLDSHAIIRAIQYAILRKNFEGVLIARAHFDMITGLANRILFESRLDMAVARLKRREGRIAVLFLDLDGFKPINDTYGHMTGDRLLKKVGEKLKQVLRPYDTPARFGGDEFAILVEGVNDEHDGEVVAAKIVELFDQPFDISGKQISVGVSIGVAYSSSDDIVYREELVGRADQAMYEAKSKPGSCYSVCDTSSEAKNKTA